MFRRKQKSPSLRIRNLRFAILLISLLISALACNFQIQQTENLRQTDVALAIMQTRIGETATAMVLQASTVPQNTPAPPSPTPEPPTAEPPTAEPPTLEPTATTEPPTVTQPAVQETLAPQVDGAAVYLTDWKMLNFVKPGSGCRGDSTLDCWVNNKSGAGSWKTGEDPSGALTLRTPVLIQESWTNPYLVFNHELKTRAFTGYLQLKIDSQWLKVKEYGQGTAWVTQAIDLRPYKGKEITVMFNSTLTSFLRTSLMEIDWSIQNIRIEPDYQP